MTHETDIEAIQGAIETLQAMSLGGEHDDLIQQLRDRIAELQSPTE